MPLDQTSISTGSALALGGYNVAKYFIKKRKERKALEKEVEELKKLVEENPSKSGESK